MNSLKRHEKIMEALLERQEVTVSDLSDLLQVTGKTVREDLDKLESMGLLVRVHGVPCWPRMTSMAFSTCAA